MIAHILRMLAQLVDEWMGRTPPVVVHRKKLDKPKYRIILDFDAKTKPKIESLAARIGEPDNPSRIFVRGASLLADVVIVQDAGGTIFYEMPDGTKQPLRSPNEDLFDNIILFPGADDDGG